MRTNERTKKKAGKSAQAIRQTNKYMCNVNTVLFFFLLSLNMKCWCCLVRASHQYFGINHSSSTRLLIRLWRVCAVHTVPIAAAAAALATPVHVASGPTPSKSTSKGGFNCSPSACASSICSWSTSESCMHRCQLDNPLNQKGSFLNEW